MDIKRAERKKAMMLHLAGEEMMDLFETLTVAAPGSRESVYSKAKEVLLLTLNQSKTLNIKSTYSDNPSKEKGSL